MDEKFAREQLGEAIPRLKERLTFTRVRDLPIERVEPISNAIAALLCELPPLPVDFEDGKESIKPRKVHLTTIANAKKTVLSHDDEALKKIMNERRKTLGIND